MTCSLASNRGSLTSQSITKSRNYVQCCVGTSQQPRVVQMLEADVFKITLLALHQTFKASGLPVEMVLLLHDGIWFTCPEERATVARVKKAIKKIMENSVSLSVPLKVTFD
jgi:DNA polymerase family A